jgi:hypothetical protein
VSKRFKLILLLTRFRPAQAAFGNSKAKGKKKTKPNTDKW